MKKLFTFITALVLACTFAVAESTTLYCKVAQSWWKENGAATGAFAWKEGGTNNHEWPGVRMTAVAGEDDLWSIQVDPAVHPNIIFVRVNASGTIADWGAQTADLTIPTDGKNLYTITSTSAAWSGNGDKVTGTWSTYTPAGQGGDDPVEEPANEYTAVGDPALFGADHNWDLNNAATLMIKQDDGTYTCTLQEATLIAGNSYAWKVVTNHSWGSGEYPASGDYHLSVDKDGKYKVVFTLDLTKDNAEAGSAKATLLEQVTIQTEYTVVGVPLLFGEEHSWDVNNTATLMSKQDDGSFTCSIAEVTLDAGDYAWKVVANHSWSGEQYPAEGDYMLEISQKGKYKVDFTLVPGETGASAKTTLIEAIDDPVENVTVYVVNTLNWETVNAFVWPAKGNAYKNWPGEAATKTDKQANKNDVYSYTFPENFVNIIFNNGTVQTTDLAWSTDKPYFVPGEKNSEDKYTGTWYAKLEDIPAVEEPEDPQGPYTIKLVPSEEWLSADAKFAAWVWTTEDDGHWAADKAFFKPLKKGSDTLKIVISDKPEMIDFVRFSPKASEPTWNHEEGTVALIWGELQTKIDYSSLVWTIVGWEEGQWTPVERPCESYGLMVDGKYVAGKKNVNQTEWLEYMVRNLKLTQGQKIQICDKCNGNATWVMEQFAPTSFTFPIQEIDGVKYYVVEEDGEYDFYIKFIYGADEVYVSKKGTYTTAVRNECTDVMIQAFYNESYKQNDPLYGTDKYGDTRWETLIKSVDSLAQDFDLIWLPPSAAGDGMGYHPKNYSNQNSNWGTQDQLTDLIDNIHERGSKVVADIVINHCQSTNGWLGFPEFDFGTYGKFQPDASYICKNDEVNADWNKESAGSDWGKATGNYDDGENWEGARDWAHDMPKVQDMFKAYLKWMRNVIGYDGFRYDKGDGFNNWHHDNYNKAAGPYIAFMECYSNTDEIQGRISGANGNLMALDFDTKWHVFDAISGWDYNSKRDDKSRGDGLIGRNDGHHAVTFIDSHDWFLRGNGFEFGGDGNSMKDYMLPRLLQANAFMLSMPGVPCVFYPHWQKYAIFLRPMIEARKFAGVHSDSEVKDEYATSTGYQATIVGKYGYLILCLGDKAHQDFSANYKLMGSYYSERDGHDESYQIWVNRTAPIDDDDTPTTIVTSEKTPVKTQKVIRDGQLFIKLGDRLYDLMGNKVK